MSVSVPRTFAALTTAYMSYLDDNFTALVNYINNNTTSDKWNSAVTLNGAAAYATATPSSIPLADVSGKIDTAWIDARTTATASKNPLS